MFNFIKNIFFGFEQVIEQFKFAPEHFDALGKYVSFYSALSKADQAVFVERCESFLTVTEIIGHDVEVLEIDEVLIASASVILAWGFKQWEYVKVDSVYLVSGTFNESSEFGKADSNISGLVGTHHLSGKMILSQNALRHGFSNNSDKRNVAIHEFAHLIDMADGSIDGLPEQISDHAFALPWFDLVAKKINEIQSRKHDIRDYATTNNAEFFSVVTEYFFERPKLLKRKHPVLYGYLQDFYKQNRAELHQTKRSKKNR